MNDCIKLILILIVVLVIFTFVTGAHKGTEHFARECGKSIYKTDEWWKTGDICPNNCPNSVSGSCANKTGVCYGCYSKNTNPRR